MTNRILLFDINGDSIGSISPLAYQALVESGLLTGERPVQPPAQIPGAPCIECDKHPRTIGIFCGCCFVRLRDHESGWASAWYGPSWDEAMEIAAQEVSHAAD